MGVRISPSAPAFAHPRLAPPSCELRLASQRVILRRRLSAEARRAKVDLQATDRRRLSAEAAGGELLARPPRRRTSFRLRSLAHGGPPPSRDRGEWCPERAQRVEGHQWLGENRAVAVYDDVRTALRGGVCESRKSRAGIAPPGRHVISCWNQGGRPDARPGLPEPAEGSRTSNGHSEYAILP